METYAPRTLEQLQRQRAKQNKSALALSSSSTNNPNNQQQQKSKQSKHAKSSAIVERTDGRTLTQMRATFLQVGLISAAAGSAYVERQGTKIICAIYGPRASKKYSTPFSERGQFIVDFKYAPFAQTNRRHKRGGTGGNAYELEEKEIQQQLTEAIAVSIQLDAFPKAVLEAYVQVLQDEGGVISTAMNCISLALADSGVMLYDMVTACESLSLDGQLYLDPSAAESQRSLDAQSAESVDSITPSVNTASSTAASASSSTSQQSAQLVLSYMPSLKQITSLTQTGTTTSQEVTQLTHLCIGGCEQLNGLMRECLVEAAKKKI